jgi:hypothetical protein
MRRAVSNIALERFWHVRRMPNETMSEVKARVLAIAMGAGLTLLFGVVAAMLASLAAVPSVMLFLSAAAFLGAGFITLRLRGPARPIEPAIGAAAAVLLISLFQLWLTPEITQDLTARQVGISLVVSAVFAFGLAWVGGVLGYRSRMRSGPRSTQVSRRASGDAPVVDRMGPSSQPAPRSG